MSIALGTDLSNNGIAFGAAVPTGGVPVGNQETTSSGGGGGGGSSKIVYTTDASQVFNSNINVKYYKGEYNDSI